MHKTYKFKLKAYYEKIVEKSYKILINNKINNLKIKF